MKTTRILADAKVSYYEKVWANPSKVVSLLDILLTDEFKEKVEAIRAEPDENKQQEMKRKTLPQFCAVGVATGFNSESLIEGKESRVMAVDIDAKDNEISGFPGNLPAYITDKKLCPDIAPYITYCGLSSRGKGYVLFLPISEPSRWQDHYRAAVEVLRTYGIKADENAASNFRRFASYDPAPYINEEAEVFTLTRSMPIHILPPQRGRRATSNAGYSYNKGEYSERNKVEACISEIERRGLDVTENLTSVQWFILGCNFAGVFREAGRVYFHRVSRYYHKKEFHYTEKETNQVYTCCLKRSAHKELRYFYKICASYGIYYKDLIVAKGRTGK